MRYIGVLVLIVIIAGCSTSGWHSEELSQAKPDKDLYQFSIGMPKKVRLPKEDPKTVAEMQKLLKFKDMKHEQATKERERENILKEHAFGSLLKAIGWGVLVFGFACHFATSIPMLKSLSSSIMTLGAASIGCGLGIQKTVQYDEALTIIGVVLVGGALLYKFRHFSLSHIKNLKIYKKIRGKTDGDN